MIKEDYVSFEIAKLLKEKGFGECSTSYISEDGGHFSNTIGKTKRTLSSPHTTDGDEMVSVKL